MKKTAVLGFGNPVRSDDGVGCFVIEALKASVPALPGLSLLDMGTSAFEVLFQLSGHERLILVDAVLNTGEPDGTVYCLPAEAAMAEVEEDPLVFLHSLKWNQALSYARKIMGEDFPEDISAYLIAVSHTRLDIGLSSEVRAAGERVAGLIASELSQEAP